MAGFEKILRLMSREDMAAAAAQLLLSLYGEETEPEGRTESPEPEWPEKSGEAAPGREDGFDESFSAMPRAEFASEEFIPPRHFVIDGAVKSEAYGEEFVHTEIVRGNSTTTGDEAAAMSDFFRRDSRRYDREFERY